MIPKTRWSFILCALASCCAAACGSSTPTCGEGYDNVPSLISEEELNTYLVSSIGIDELAVDDGEHNTLVQAHFSDFSDYSVILAPRMDFRDYPACYVITGKPEISGAPIPMHVDSVAFTGLTEEVLLLPDENGNLPPELLPVRGFAAEQIGIEVSSGSEDGDFPAFEDFVAAPAMPVLEAVDGRSYEALREDCAIGIAIDRVEPLRVEWEPAEGDYVEFKIIPNSGASTDYMKLRCITFDDGCLEVPPGALGNLALDAATNFRLRLERHRFTLHSIKSGDEVEAAALIDASASMETLVTR
ncbi:MAG: hypothetical protein JXR96_28560 [Deltaproteobacteria bacterium]|nr:hypothetical protein [Deltaproteobacteria bacterium]